MTSSTLSLSLNRVKLIRNYTAEVSKSFGIDKPILCILNEAVQYGEQFITAKVTKEVCKSNEKPLLAASVSYKNKEKKLSITESYTFKSLMNAACKLFRANADTHCLVERTSGITMNDDDLICDVLKGMPSLILEEI